MKRHAFPLFLRTEATGVSDYAGESLSERLDAFIKNEESAAPAPVAITASATPAEPAAPAEPATPAVTPIPDTEEEGDELPAFGVKQTTAAAPSLDFDAQTEAIVAAITAKGHPGDEYKRLRSELKALKEQKSVTDLDSIPEVQTLRQQAAEAERLRGEAEALRQRNKELLQANNEVEVKESDEFITQVREPIRAIEKLVGQIAETSKIDPASIFAVIAETDIIKQDQMLEQLHQKLGSRTAGRIERFCDDYKAAEAKGAALLASSGTNAEKARLARETAARQEAEQKVQLFKASVESSFTKYAKSVPGFTDSSGQLTDVAIAAMNGASVVDLNTLGPDDIGYLAFTATALPEARKAIAALRKELAILKGTRQAPAPISGQPAPTPTGADDFEGLADRMKGMEFTFTPPS